MATTQQSLAPIDSCASGSTSPSCLYLVTASCCGNASPAATIGGGRVLDAHPLPNLRKGKCLAWLEALKHASLEEQLRLRVARRGTAGLTMRKLMAETGLTREALHRLTEPLVSSNRLLRIPEDMLLTDEAFGISHRRRLSAA